MSTASKKSGKAAKEVPVFHPRDMVLSKLKGYPAWPSMVVDPESVNEAVRRERPRAGKPYCVRFFPKGDYAWLPPREVSKLTMTAVRNYIDDSSKKKGELLEGYETCLNIPEWEARVASNSVPADDTQDELEDEYEGESASVLAGKTNKKRKRAAGESASAKKGKETKGKETKGKKASGKNGAGKSKADPEAQKVREWRHKLQKMFLGKTPAKDEDMPSADALLKTVEDYDKMEIKYLQFSKIAKVMRHITGLDGIPRNDEFKFSDRAQVLVDKWSTMIGKGGKGEPTKEESKADVKAEEKPTTNGNGARAGDESPMDQDAATNGDVKEAGADADADADVAAPEVNGAPAPAATEDAVKADVAGDVTMGDEEKTKTPAADADVAMDDAKDESAPAS
ncbi:hypothetical protein BDV98DRAFT_262336 [Pterulicium gracile]|uniref:PWWP domain-containing protein n=1 Tax=Pterulicium gracile TaxID=1884261 RepID=A0A5C3QAL2_9AGAR|nr:hypothetical protein BDV98DRAFT_262336 [Pterula gracilis]